MNVKIEESWRQHLGAEFEKSYFVNLTRLVSEEYQNHACYPPGQFIFNAFNLTPFDEVKVVILGQDPYHGEGEAHGLSFSVPQGVKIPPSLRNIFKELKSDLNIDPPASGNLEQRAKQGVLLLNAGLTVRKDAPNSHKDIGRHHFTDQKTGLVFILRGAFAQQKETLIDRDKHFIIKSPHPSPFSADRGFF